MEEKILIKGTFGGKIIPVLLYILAVAPLVILTIFDIVDSWDGFLIFIGAILSVILFIFAFIIDEMFKKRELIVTNKRVIARGAFEYRTDLPIEKITNISTRCFGGIGCGTPSTKIRFHFCKNKQEIFDTIASETLKRDSAFLG